MTQSVLPFSRSKDYSEQKDRVNSLIHHIGVQYAIPSAIEAATAIFTHHVRSGERLYTENPMTYTRCSEQISGKHPIVIGGFSRDGISIGYIDRPVIEYFGVSCVRKL